jgi:hypothetical protein
MVEELRSPRSDLIREITDQIYASNSLFMRWASQPRDPVYGPPTPSFQIGYAATFTLDNWKDEDSGCLVTGDESETLTPERAQELVDWLQAWVIR